MEKKKKTIKIISVIVSVVVVISSIIVMAFPVSANSALISWYALEGTQVLNPMQLSSITFKKNKTPNFPNSVETTPYGLPVYNTNNGVYYQQNTVLAETNPNYNDNIYFTTSSNEYGETSGMYLYYKTKHQGRISNTGSCITQQTYELYSGGVWDNSTGNQITGEYITLYHDFTINASSVVLYLQPNDIDRNLSEFYIYFASNAIGGDFTLGDIESRYNNISINYDVYVPEVTYDGSNQTTAVGFNKIFSVNSIDKIEDNTTYRPFEILMTRSDFREQLPTNKPIIIKNLSISMDLYGTINNTHNESGFKYRINIGQPNQYSGDIPITSVNSTVANVIENITFDNFSFIHWITTNINSIMEIEFFGLITLGNVMWVAIALALLGLFLRLFAGG